MVSANCHRSSIEITSEVTPTPLLVSPEAKGFDLHMLLGATFHPLAVETKLLTVLVCFASVYSGKGCSNEG